MYKKIYNAYYSTQCDELFGHCLYKNTNGETIMACAIYGVDEPQTFMWPDAVLVGQVQDGGLIRGLSGGSE